MKINEKLVFLKEHHLGEWMKTRRIVEDEISSGQSFFCICGRMATGFHEMNCAKFQKKVDSKTAKQMKHLITNHNPKGA